jgi:hypothetical protein
MSTFRFALVSVGVFALTFVGMLWGTKNFPVMAMRSEPAKPVAQTAPAQVAQPQAGQPQAAPTVEEKKSLPPKAAQAATQTATQVAVQVPTFEESVKKGIRKDWEVSKTAQGDGDPKREALRLATLQAANAFALSPCDATMKKNLVEALSAYAKAWTEMAGCKFGVCGGDDRKIGAAAASFSTPSDMRVRQAVSAAFEKGGISRDDFPGSTRLWVTMLAGDPGDPVSACATGRRAEGRR